MFNSLKISQILSILLISGITLLPHQGNATDTCKVPLKLVDIKNDPENPEYKLGIYVGLGGGAPKLYELDTGGSGFWAAYNGDPAKPEDQWWGDYYLTKGEKLIIQYTSGNQYTANLANTSVGLYSGDGTSFTQECVSAWPIGVAQIVKYQNQKDPEAVSNWYEALANGLPPLFNNFYGDFGAALSPVFSTTKSAAIYSALPQMLGSKTSNGFMVHVGSLDKNADPSLTIGITDGDRASFPIQLPMNPYCADSGNPVSCTARCNVWFPISNLCTYREQLINADIQWLNGNLTTQRFSNIGLTLDTGAPSATIYQNPQIFVKKPYLNEPTRQNGFWTGDFADGTWLMISANPAKNNSLSFNYLIETGSTKSVNKVSAGTRTPTSSPYAPKWTGYMNTGLMLYTSYDVMFDLEYGVVRLKPLRK